MERSSTRRSEGESEEYERVEEVMSKSADIFSIEQIDLKRHKSIADTLHADNKNRHTIYSGDVGVSKVSHVMTRGLFFGSVEMIVNGFCIPALCACAM